MPFMPSLKNINFIIMRIFFCRKKYLVRMKPLIYTMSEPRQLLFEFHFKVYEFLYHLGVVSFLLFVF